MNKNDILEILEKFEASNSVSFSYKDKDSELKLKKEGAFAAKNPVVMQAPAMQQMPATQAPVQPTIAQNTNAPAEQTATNTDANLVEVKSPIVGTFYRQPSPDAHPFVEEGQAIKAGDTLCILEAMKMLNTLDSEINGTIEKILVNSGDLVEFDQPLFLVRV